MLSSCFTFYILFVVDATVISSPAAPAKIHLNPDPGALRAHMRTDMDYLQSNDTFLGLDTAPKTHFKIEYENRRTARETNRLLRFLEHEQATEAQAALQTVSVTGYGSIANWTLVSSALSKTPNLISMEWHNNAPIPLPLLESLERAHPNLHLSYEIPFSNWDRYDCSVEPIQFVGKEPHHITRAKERQSILNLSILHSVKGSIGYGGQHSPDDMALIHGILTTCPNVKHLDLSVQWAGGCCVGAEQPYGFDFSASSPFHGKTMVPLESIKLDGYQFDNMLNGYRLGGKQTRYLYSWPFSMMPQRVLHYFGNTNVVRWGFAHAFVEGNMQVPATNLDGWLEHMDWSHVQTLELDSASVDTVKKLQPVLKSLRSLTVHYAGCGSTDSWHELLNSTTSPLTNLSLANFQRKDYDQTVNIITSHHGPHLTSLRLTESETFRSYDVEQPEGSGRNTMYHPHIYLSPSHLQSLASSCPNLTDLNIDLNRTSLTSLDNPVLDVLPSFSNLTTLTLRIESPDIQHRRLHPTAEPHWQWRMQSVGKDKIVNGTSVLALFHNLRVQQQRRRAQGENAVLEKMGIMVGKWEQRYGHGMGRPPRHLAGHWECTLDAEGKERCDGQSGYPGSVRFEGVDDEMGEEGGSEDGGEEEGEG